MTRHSGGRVGDVTVVRQHLIGMIGGMSWESSAEYYRLANELVRARLGGLHSARVLLASVDFAEIEQLQVTGRWDEAARLLADIAKGLEAAGAELLLLCTNTMHKVADQVQDAVSIPLLHLADAAAAAVIRAGLGTIGLLGTAFTREQDFYRDRLAAHGLRVLVPDPDDRADVHRIIYDELCQGVVREESRVVYRGGHRPSCAGRRAGRGPRVHRDRIADRCLRQPGPALPNYPAPCRGCRRCSARRDR
jgi:aspartate racemase